MAAEKHRTGKTPAVHPKGLHEKPGKNANASAYVKGTPTPKGSSAYHLYKKYSF